MPTEHTNDVLNGRIISAVADELKPSTVASRSSETTPNATIFRGSKHIRYASNCKLSAHQYRMGEKILWEVLSDVWDVACLRHSFFWYQLILLGYGQLARGCYLTVWWQGLKLTTTESLVPYHSHQTIELTEHAVILTTFYRTNCCIIELLVVLQLKRCTKIKISNNGRLKATQQNLCHTDTEFNI